VGQKGVVLEGLMEEVRVVLMVGDLVEDLVGDLVVLLVGSWVVLLEGSYLVEVQMAGSYLVEVRKEGSYLVEDRMEGNYLVEDRMEGSYLVEGRMVESRLEVGVQKVWLVQRKRFWEGVPISFQLRARMVGEEVVLQTLISMQTVLPELQCERHPSVFVCLLLLQLFVAPNTDLLLLGQQTERYLVVVKRQLVVVARTDRVLEVLMYQHQTKRVHFVVLRSFAKTGHGLEELNDQRPSILELALGDWRLDLSNTDCEHLYQ